MKTRWTLAIAVIAVLASACQTVETASTMRTLDDQMREILVQQASQDDELVRQVTSDQALADLAARAVYQVNSALGDSERIALYRIAAVAYWKAGAAGENNIGDVVAAGTALCRSAVSKPPRDCAAIALALPAAQIESEKRKLDDLEAAARQGPLSEDQLEQSVLITDRMFSATVRLLQMRPPGTDIAVPTDLREYVDRQVLLSYCNAGRARAFAIEKSPAGLPAATREEYRRVRSETTRALGQEPVCMERKDLRSRALEEAQPAGR